MEERSYVATKLGVWTKLEVLSLKPPWPRGPRSPLSKAGVDGKNKLSVDTDEIYFGVIINSMPH